MKRRFFLNARFSAIALLGFATLAGATLFPQLVATAYREIPVAEFLDQRQLVRQDPRTVALLLFSEFLQESEGRRSEQLAIDYPSWDNALATVTIVGLADDSVPAIRYRLEFQQTEGEWQLTYVGSQSRCQRGRGHQEWGGQNSAIKGMLGLNPTDKKIASVNIASVNML